MPEHRRHEDGASRPAEQLEHSARERHLAAVVLDGLDECLKIDSLLVTQAIGPVPKPNRGFRPTQKTSPLQSSQRTLDALFRHTHQLRQLMFHEPPATLVASAAAPRHSLKDRQPYANLQ